MSADQNRPARQRPLSGLVVGLTLLTAIGVTAASNAPDLVSRADANQTVASGAGDSSAPTMTGDGRFVVFISSAGNLVTNDSNGAPDVFVRDRILGRTSLVSVSADGAGSANSASASPSISSNGQFVVFQSRASNLTTNATNGWENIFVRNMFSGATALVSVSTNGAACDYSSLNPQMTPDGRLVVFESLADNLVQNDTNQLSDVFVRDLVNSNTVLVSVNTSGNGSSAGYAINPSITPDGRFVVFESTAANLVTNDFNTKSDIFLRDLVAGTTTLISAGTNGNAAGTSQNAVISDDGRYIAFESTVNTLVAGDSDGLNDIFLRDVQTGTTTLISPLADFNTASSTPSRPVISHDGRLVAFETGVPPFSSLSVSTNCQIYLWDAQTVSNVLISVGLDGVSQAAGVSYSPVISADDRYISFLSNATNLVAGTTNGMFQVYQRDLVTGLTTLVSANREGNGNNLDCSSISVSDDGRSVAFDTLDGDLVADDNNYSFDVFVRNLDDNITELISPAAQGVPSATPPGMSILLPGCLSADGRYAVFTTLAPNLAPNDTNGTSDVFVRDLWNGTNSLVSVNANGSSGNGASRNPVISADARFVAFTSQATDLTSGVTNRKGNIFLRDLQSGTTTLVSANASGQGGNGASINPTINADGRRIAFETLAADLGTNDSNNTSDVFVHDRAIGTNVLASVGMNGLSGNGASRAPIMTADGRFVIFLSDATSLAPTNTTAPAQLFARDLVNNETFLVSVDSATVRNQIGPGSQVLSKDGRFLAYTGATNVYLFDLIARTNTLIYSGGFNASISGNGRFIAFEKPLYTNSLPNSLNNSAIVVWDTQLQAEILASVNITDVGTGNAFSRSPVLSADGRFVVFKSQATDLAGKDANAATDVFVRDLVLGQTILIGLNASGAVSGNRLSGNPAIGADGRTILFESFASDLASRDFNEVKDIFVFHLNVVDSDNDGMDDDWEMAYFGTLSRDGTGDFDGDGATDLAEFKAGTDPTNDGSILRALTVTSLSDGSATVYWNAVSGRTYQVQCRDSIADANWINLPGTVVAAGSTAVKTDTTNVGKPNRFYRVVLISP